MIRVNPRLSRLLLGTVLAAALCIPASAAPSGEVFVKLPPGSTAAKDDHKDHIEILSYSWGAAANSDMVLKGSKIGENAAAGGVSVAAGDVTGDGAPAASGLPTGKRQHKPVRMTMELGRGSVSLQTRSPWPDCKVGTQYPELELGDGGNAYKLQDAMITSCASDRVSLNYAKKVTVKGWNPEKKEE
jgi:hypothetical protein